MATTWTNGAATGNVQTAGNWADASVPATGNLIQFGDYGGSVANASAGLDLTTFGVVGLNRITVTEHYTGRIGNSSADPLIVDTNNGTTPYVKFAGGGASQMFLRGSQTKVVCDSRSTASPCLHIGGGTETVTDLHILRGRVQLGATCTFTNIFMNDASPGSAYLTMDASMTPTTIEQSAGIIDAESVPTTLNIRGGIYRSKGPSGSGTFTTMRVGGQGGGKVEMWVKGQTITRLDVYQGGTFDASRLGGILTITNTYFHHPDADIITSRFITFTNNPVLVGTNRLPRIHGEAAQTISVAI